ncbi:acyl dehydratase [Micrococcales bacterium 31B]|nr:acyl dehydratase [Micrococcales bacterium 31B]
MNDLSVGDEIGRSELTFTRDTLVRYAGASGDFNPIHYNDAFAQSVGLDGVIAHGMLTMGSAVTLVTNWLDDPSLVAEYVVRFTKPVPVPNPGSVTVAVVGKVAAVKPESLRIDLTVTVDDVKVLGKAQVTVKL